LKHVCDSILHPGGHFEATLVHDCFGEHLVDGIIEVLLFVGFYSSLYLYLFLYIVDSVFEGVSMHFELIFKHQRVDQLVCAVFCVNVTIIVWQLWL